ncbi:MAG TPA: hypothetical protein PLB52_02445 [Candidatus Moranbacteria bacterium]|nr:hypothetical protein [Candidatus Moranbacteria bacterium]
MQGIKDEIKTPPNKGGVSQFLDFVGEFIGLRGVWPIMPRKTLVGQNLAKYGIDKTGSVASLFLRTNTIIIIWRIACGIIKKWKTDIVAKTSMKSLVN